MRMKICVRKCMCTCVYACVYVRARMCVCVCVYLVALGQQVFACCRQDSQQLLEGHEGLSQVKVQLEPRDVPHVRQEGGVVVWVVPETGTQGPA